MESKGSITVFMSMTLLMCLALVFSMIEVVRFSSLGLNTGAVSKIGIESAFADYNRLLWKDYGILAIDGGYGGTDLQIDKLESKVAGYVNNNINYGTNYTKATINNVVLSKYGLLSDSDGEVLIVQGYEFIKENLPQTLLLSLQDRLDTDVSMNEDEIEQILRETKEGMEEIAGENTVENGAEVTRESLPADFVNPIDAALEWKSRAILSQVVTEVSELSAYGYSNVPPSERSLNQGNADAPSVSAIQKTIFTQYLRQNFSSYRNNKEHCGLKYEWEALIGGKKSDVENLESAIIRLLAIREGQNLISIYQDPVKISEATTIAVSIAGAMAVPALVEPIKIAVIAAWAYLESVLDVRLLLKGGSLPLVKTSIQWTSSILAFPSYIHPSVTAKDCEIGLDYEDYLSMITLLLGSRTIGKRMLDVLENALVESADYSGISIDDFIYCGEMEFEYSTIPMFASFIPMLGNTLESYKFLRKEALSYI